jgi:hypothetical protein
LAGKAQGRRREPRQVPEPQGQDEGKGEGMKRGKKVDFWFPLYVDKWLWGSTRHELDHPERAIFTDLMALATKDDGYIRANETTPYPHPQLAGILCCSIELLESAIQKCIKFGKIEDKGDGVYYICNWKEYSFSVRWIREVDKSKKECSEKTEGTSENLPDSRKPYSIVSSNIVSSKLDKNLIPIKDEFASFWEAYPKKVAKDDAFDAFKALRKKVPLTDIVSALNGYSAVIKREQKPMEFIMYPASFLRKNKWKDFVGVKYTPPL